MVRKRRRKVKTRFWFICLFLIAIIAIGCGLIYSLGGSGKDIFSSLNKGNKEPVSVVSECVEAQRNLDGILLLQKWQLVEKSRVKKEIKIPETGGVVLTSERTVGVGVPEELNPKDAAALLKAKLAGTGLVYIGGEDALYNDKYDGYKCQIGVAVKAGRSKRNFVSDTLIFFNNLNLGKTKEQLAKRQRHFEGKLAIVIDDCGTDIKPIRSLLNIDLPFNFSILPDKTFSSDVLAAVNAKGRVAMLHLPMEPINRAAMSEGANTILTEMTHQQIAALTRKHLQNLYGVVGVNNHQGSKVTANRAQMKTVLSVLKEQKMFFMDSKTNSETVARDVAREMGVKTCMNDKFLDNSTNPEAIREEVYKVMEMAERNGSAIAICHARPNTVAMWLKYADEFKATGITFVPVTDLLY